MPCDTRLKPRQTISDRANEVRRVVDTLSRKLAAGMARVKIGPQGAVAFEGLSNSERDGVTDACAYRRIMSTGSAMARAAIERAEQMSGRTIDKKVVAQGGHYHGDVYHTHKG